MASSESIKIRSFSSLKFNYTFRRVFARLFDRSKSIAPVKVYFDSDDDERINLFIINEVIFQFLVLMIVLQ